MKPYKAIFTSPPIHIPTNGVVDGPIIGNGDTGVALSGFPQSLRFWISKNDFWRALEGQAKWSRESLFGSPCSIGYLDLTLESVASEHYTVEQNLQFADIIGCLQTLKQEPIEFRSWVCATENMLIIELTSASRQTVQMSLTPQTGWMSTTEAGYDSEQTLWMKRSFTDEKLAWPTEAIVCLKHITGGTPLGTLSYVQLEPGQKTVFAASICTNHETPAFAEQAKQRIERLTIDDISVLRESHEDWWNGFWQKSEVEIGDELLERFYYGSQYIMACCSRNKEFPPGIFGNWITTDTPLWAGDYHLNYNYQAPYWGVFSSNHVELSEPYDAPIIDYMKLGKEKSKVHLGMQGIYYEVGIGPKGLQTAREKFWGQKSNAAYAAINMIMRFYHTYDTDYARKVYPFLLEVANFWEQYLSFEGERYVIRGDASIEYEDNQDETNSSLSLGLLKALFSAIMDFSRELGADQDKRETWQHILERLSDFPVFEREGRRVFRMTEQGVDWMSSNTLPIQHIYPAGTIGLGSNPELLEIGRNTVEILNRWEDFNGFPTIFPAAVRVGYDAEIVMEQLRLQCRNHGYPNLFIYYGGGGIECCSTVPLTINEMLMQSHEGVIRLFPVWPDKHDARFRDLRAVGAFLISAELKDGAASGVRIVSEKGRPIVIENPWPGLSVKVYAHNGGGAADVEIIQMDGDRYISFDTQIGFVYTIEH